MLRIQMIENSTRCSWFLEKITHILNLHKGQIPSKSIILVGPKPQVVNNVSVQLRLVEKPMKFCQN